MYCNTCEASPCTCAAKRSDAGMTRSTYRPQPNGITKEEFGLNLYEAIRMIGGIDGLTEQITMATTQGEGYKIQDLRTRKTAIQHQLAAHLPILTNSEMDQILARYPGVVAF